MPIPTLLIVDDEPNIRLSLQQSLETSTLRVICMGNAREAIEQVRIQTPDAILLDVRLPDMSGLEAYNRIREIDSLLPVIIMTAYAKTETAIEATRRGAFDYLIKPVDLKHLRETVTKAVAVSRLRKVPAVMAGEETNDSTDEADVIVGKSAPMQDVYKTIGRVASMDAPVLILGESGTGKELVARAIFHYSRRKDKPFLAINCAALSESLLESELFGHERGAFTGADQRRIGKFEQVNGGTIFLDEIGDMSQATQAKALRLLQQQQFERVGGNTTIQTDVRIIAATNRDLTAMVAAGKFRRDLFYRLNVFTIQLPPLRERLADIPELAKSFLRRISSQSGHPFRLITQESLDLLQQHDWPGNVRELESAMKYALAHSGGDIILPDSFPQSCRTPHDSSTTESSNSSARSLPLQSTVPGDNLDITALTNQLLKSGSTNIYREVGSLVDKLLLETVLKHVHGNLQQAAELLGISRMTLRNKLRTINVPASESADDASAGDVD